MIDGVIIKKLNKNIDSRGWLAETWRSDEADFRPMMSYISLTKPETVRGPHEHIKQTDRFIFVGPGKFVLHLWDRREHSKTKGQYQAVEAGGNEPCLVAVPPGVVHGYKNISRVDAYCINLPDRLYCGQGKKEEVDEIRWEKDPMSPYKII